MINIFRYTIHALLLYTGLICTVYADETPRQFDIELLIFQNLNADDGGEVWPVDYSEWFVEDTPVPDETTPDTEFVVIPETSPRDEKSPDEPEWLPSESLHLQAEQRALEHSGHYRPLRYLAWRQTVVDRNRAQDIEIPPATTESPVKIEGTVRVAVERYLHLYLDLKLVDTTLAFETDLSDYDLPEFRMKQRRRMRSKELHYFDHPKFGVIALITPYVPPVQEPEPQPENTAPPVTSEPVKKTGQ